MKTLKFSRCLPQYLFGVLLIGFPHSIQAQSSLPNEKFWQQIKKFDSLVAQGSVNYRRQIQDNGISQLYCYKLKYDSQSRYQEQLTMPGTKSSPGQVSTTLFDGQDSFQINGNTVFIVSGLPVGVNPALYWVLNVYPKPSLPMGRGLSQLENASVVWKGRWATVRGRLTDGTNIVAQVDTGDHYLVRKVKRFEKTGRLVGVTTTMGALCDGLIAEKSSYETKGSVENTTFTSARFSTPDPSQFRFPLRGSLRIIDQRLGAGMMMKKSSPGEISKADLLEITQASLQKRTQQQSNTILVEKVQSAINFFVMLLPALLFGTWFSLSRSKTKTQD